MTSTLVADIAARLTARRECLAVAESCTGGQLAAACTALAGCSAWFERGLVTYANRAKQDLLGVPETVLASHGAVSEACVRAMAEGLLARAPVQHVIAVSGIAGPAGGSAEKPVGLVWIAWGGRSGIRTRRFDFAGDRLAVQSQATSEALRGLLDQLILA